jgi:hypothetical protein
MRSIARTTVSPAGPASLRFDTWARALGDPLTAFSTFHRAIEFVVMPVTKTFGQLRLAADAARKAFGAVMLHVLGAIIKLEVSQPVVRPVAVFVVNHFIFEKCSAEVFGHHPSVLQDHPGALGVWMVRSIDQDVAVSGDAHVKGGY